MSWKVAAQYLLRQPQHHRQKNENNVIYRRYCKGIVMNRNVRVLCTQDPYIDKRLTALLKKWAHPEHPEF